MRWIKIVFQSGRTLYRGLAMYGAKKAADSAKGTHFCYYIIARKMSDYVYLPLPFHLLNPSLILFSLIR